MNREDIKYIVNYYKGPFFIGGKSNIVLLVCNKKDRAVRLDFYETFMKAWESVIRLSYE